MTIDPAATPSDTFSAVNTPKKSKASSRSLGGADAHDTWDHKLVASLKEALGPRYTIRYPPMPDEANSDAAKWKEAVAHALTRSAGDVSALGDPANRTDLWPQATRKLAIVHQRR